MDRRCVCRAPCSKLGDRLQTWNPEQSHNGAKVFMKFCLGQLLFWLEFCWRYMVICLFWLQTYWKKSKIWPQTTLSRIWEHWADIGQLGRHWTDIGQALGRYWADFSHVRYKNFWFSHPRWDFLVSLSKIRLWRNAWRRRRKKLILRPLRSSRSKIYNRPVVL